MATDINHVVLVGRLTRDAELRYANSGTPICHFSIANSYRKKQGDTWGEDTNYFDCVMFGNRAEAVHKYLTKGTQVAVDGALRFSKWEKDGQTRSKVEVHVNEFNFMSGRRDGGSRPGGQDRAGAPQSPGESNSGSEFEDDVPF
ncbi:MAG: single-stranded DNA-binding protein [Spirochaetia bacterium]